MGITFRESLAPFLDPTYRASRGLGQFSWRGLRGLLQQIVEQDTISHPFYEVGRQRGTVSLPTYQKPSGGFLKTALFQRPLPEPCRLLSQHTALQAWDVVCLDRLFPYGSRPPAHGRGRFHSPAALPPVLGITPGIRVLRVLCDPAALAV